MSQAIHLLQATFDTTNHPPPSLPEGWVAYWIPDCQEYYFVQLSTGATQWDIPTDPAATSATPQGNEHPHNPPIKQEKGEGTRVAGGGAHTNQIPFSASAYASDHKHHLLLACSGSVATIKLPLILHALSTHPALSIRLLLTSSAHQFLSGQSAEQPSLSSLLSIPNVDSIFLDADEWTTPWKRGNEILHIELRRWAHMLVIAPLSANTMAKIVSGLADNLLTSVVRAWDTEGVVEGAPSIANTELGFRRKIIVVAPAMNTAMWRHPVTKTQLRVLEEDWGVTQKKGSERGSDVRNGGWFEVMRPMEKELACGDVGTGAMREWKDIVGLIEKRLGL